MEFSVKGPYSPLQEEVADFSSFAEHHDFRTSDEVNK